MFQIKQEEPEGWQKAFAIYFAGKRITHCSFRDTAESWVAEHFA